MNFERVSNEIYFPAVVTVQTTKAFRKPFVIQPYENLVDGDGVQSLAAFKTYDAKVIDKNGAGMRPVAEVTLHVKPDSEAAHNFIMIEPVPFSNSYGVMAGDHSEQVSFEIDWQDGSSITLSQGVLIRSRRTVDDYQFSFSFSQVIRD
ncbi:hypothetical protein [Caballeronia sordidicola]|uniref:hypothetical protein n=1 Tax=Caballeronia sordidicola TaxID=196367 RepID=UPI0004D03E7B|nr:hypothetical protein [Caballeronia sordidicola]